MSTCQHCGRPKSGQVSQVCLGGEACELQAQLAEREERIQELEEALAKADEELELYHPGRRGGW